MSSRKATEIFCFIHTTQYIYEEDNKSNLERLGRQVTFKFRALWSVRDGKGLILEEAMKAQKGSRNTTPSSTSALDGQRHVPPLYPRETDLVNVVLCSKLGGPQGRYGQVRKIFPLPGFDPQTVQPVAGRYTD